MDLRDILNHDDHDPFPLPLPRHDSLVPRGPIRYDGHIASPPAPSSPLAYKEDVIVDLITQILRMLMRIRHCKESDFVFPPLGGHRFDEALCHQLRLAPAVVSLLRRLPYFKDTNLAEHINIRTGSMMPNYLDKEHMRRSRAIFGLPRSFEGPLEPSLFPQDVLLFFHPEEDGETWILDTEANTIRRYQNGLNISEAKKAFPNYTPPFPAHAHHYRNAVALHAPTLLSQHLDDLLTLRMMPCIELDYHQIQFTEDWPGAPEVRRRLYEEFYWPDDDFRAEEWNARKRDVWDDAKDWLRAYPNYQPKERYQAPRWL